MDKIVDLITRGARELVDRFDGPLHFRLFVMPTIVTLVAIRAGIRDARNGEPPFLWALLTDQHNRPRLFRSAVKDIGRIFLTAVVLDSAYQLFVLHAFHVGQLLIVAVACAVVPYVVVRGPASRIARALGVTATPTDHDVEGQA